MELKTIVILGMHRSATSLIAKSLHIAGCSMGDDLLGPSASNPWGHWEDKDFLHLNDRILGAAGGSWDKPPPESEILKIGGLFDGEISKKVQAKNDSAKAYVWGWKDPRTTLTIRLFHRYLTNPVYVSCVRDPLEVGKSLEGRGDMGREAGRVLAREYNSRMLKFLHDVSWEEI